MTTVDNILAIRLVYAFVLFIMCNKRAPYIVAQFMPHEDHSHIRVNSIFRFMIITWTLGAEI